MKRLAFVGLLFLSACFINYLGKGYEAYQRFDLDSAEKFFRTAVKKRPRDPIAYNNLGLVLMDLDRTEEAIPFLKFAVVLSAKTPTPYASPHINLGRAYFEMGNLDLAKESGEKGVAIDGANPIGLLIMANIYLARNENLPMAKTYAATAAEKIFEPDKPAAWSTLAEAEYKLRNIEAAIKAIDTAIALDTDNAFYRQQKALYQP